MYDLDNYNPDFNILTSLTGIKFTEQNNSPPITLKIQAPPKFLAEALETDDNNSFYDDNPMMNADPMLNSADKKLDTCAWKDKPVDRWMTEDVLFWVSDESEKAGLFILNADMPKLCALTGADLIAMTLEDFLNKMSNESFARRLYNSLQNNILNPNNRNNIESDVLTTLRTCVLDDTRYNYGNGDNFNGLSVNDSTIRYSHDSGIESSSDSEQCYESLQHPLTNETMADYGDYISLINNNYNSNRSSTDPFETSDSDNNYNSANQEWFLSLQSDYSNEYKSQITNDDDQRPSDAGEDRLTMPSEVQIKEEIKVPIKKKPGRPRGIRKKKPEKIGRLWEFLRDLLHNPKYNPSLICWDNYEIGKFRFVRSEKVAQMWGSKRENSMMTFDKFSRAMRYYYKGNVLIAVQKRLVYQFGDNATGWRTPNPILR